MAMIKLLHAQDQSKVQGTRVDTNAVSSAPAAAPSDAQSDVLGALDDLLAGATPKVAPAPVTEPDAAVLSSPAEPVQAEPVVAVAAPVPVPASKEKPPGFLKQAALKNEVKKDTHRAALDYLNILKSLAPVFKAAFIYPGHDAAPDQLGAAVRKMSQVSVGLADYIATHGDQLEVDGAWARKTLHDFTADLVANHWISSVLGKGGAVPGHSPDISIDFFIPAVRAVMELPTDLPAAHNKLNLSLGGAVQISLLKAMTPVALEAERFADIVNARIPSAPVKPESLIAEIAQFVMEQALAQHERFVAENSDITDDDRRMMLQALISHSSGTLLSAWEYCRGEVLGAIQDAATPEAAAEIMAHAQFAYGFPLQALKTRAADSLRRLTGTSQYALSTMRQSAERGDRKGA